MNTHKFDSLKDVAKLKPPASETPLERIADALEKIAEYVGNEKTVKKRGERLHPAINDVLRYYDNPADVEVVISKMVDAKKRLGKKSISAIELSKGLRYEKKITEDIKFKIRNFLTDERCGRLSLAAKPGESGIVRGYKIVY